MNKDLLERVIAYRQAMAAAKGMLHRGIITAKEYDEIDTIMTKKYRLNIGTIFR